MNKNKMINRCAAGVLSIGVATAIYNFPINKDIEHDSKSNNDLIYNGLTFRSELERKLQEHEDLKKYEESLAVAMVAEEIACEEIIEEDTTIYEEPVQEAIFYYDPYDLSIPTNMSVYDMEVFLQNSSFSGLAESFLYFQDVYGVNAVFVAGMAMAESAYGYSDIAMSKNNITSIMSSGEAVYFDSMYECIDYTFRLLSNHYLSADGLYYNGTSIYGVNERYCPNDNYYWSNLIISLINGLL